MIKWFKGRMNNTSKKRRGISVNSIKASIAASLLFAVIVLFLIAGDGKVAYAYESEQNEYLGTIQEQMIREFYSLGWSASQQLWNNGRNEYGEAGSSYGSYTDYAALSKKQLMTAAEQRSDLFVYVDMPAASSEKLMSSISSKLLLLSDASSKVVMKEPTSKAVSASKASKQFQYADDQFMPENKRVLKEIKVMATGYTAGVESTGKGPKHPEYGVTYSGVKVRRDYVSTIAADLKEFPIGTILYIPGYGYGIVADIGSAIKGKKIDLFFDTTKQVYSQWGKKEVDVQLVKRGSGKITEKLLEDLNAAVLKYHRIPETMM